MHQRNKPLRASIFLLLLISFAALSATQAARAQLLGNDHPQLIPAQENDKIAAAPKAKREVEFLYPSFVHLKPGQVETVAVGFRITDGLHINSHQPKDAFLIPTSISFTPTSGVKVVDTSYPEGKDVTLPVAPDQRLNVYSGDITLLVKLSAEAGSHQMEGVLHYQACDNNACMPPRTLKVVIDVTVGNN